MVNNNNKIRVVVPYANNSDILPQCKDSLVKLKAYNGIRADIYQVQGASISVLRSNGTNDGMSTLVKQSLSHYDYDYYMCIDSDIEFNPEDVQALVNRNVDIISGFYQFRYNNNYGVAGTFQYTGCTIHKDGFLKWDSTGLKEVDWVGAGFLLIKREVLENIDFPYFREGILTYINNDGKEEAQWHGEDVGFCISAKKAGYKIYVDCDVKVNHIINEPFREEIKMEKVLQLLQDRRDYHNQIVTAINRDKEIIAQYQENINKMTQELLMVEGGIRDLQAVVETTEIQSKTVEEIEKGERE